MLTNQKGLDNVKAYKEQTKLGHVSLKDHYTSV